MALTPSSQTVHQTIASSVNEGLAKIESMGPKTYYSRFGISKIIKLPIFKCQEYFENNQVQLFKCKKVKAVQWKQKHSSKENAAEDADDDPMGVFPEPYDIYIVVTEKAIFTTLDVKTDSSKHEWMYVDSRYTMYDLIKITSRKNSGNVITFYFKTPTYEDYNISLEDKFLERINEKPSEDYVFAHKRQKSIETCVVVMFDNSEVAHQCISKVSHLYKMLKAAK